MQQHPLQLLIGVSARCLRMRVAVLLALLMLGAPGAALELPVERATALLSLKSELLRDMGIRLEGTSGVPDETERTLLGFASPLVGSLVIRFEGRSFEGFGAGALENGDGPRLVSAGGQVDLAGYSIRAGSDSRVLVIRAKSGLPLFRVDHIHFHHDPATGSFALRNADLRIASELASQLGNRRLDGRAVGVFELDAVLPATPQTGAPESGTPQSGAPESGTPQSGAPQSDAPRSAPLRAPAAAGDGVGEICVEPNFDLPVDIALTQITLVEQSARSGGRVAITPAATLQNVGQAEVRWEPTLDPDHPVLVWALYRLLDDRFEQIGISQTKHAFFALNEDCPCPQGEILWAQGCTDIYGVSTNEDRFNLTPRSEVTAFTVGWDPCGSIFDPECDGIHDFPAPADAFDLRMAVPELELQQEGARYFIEAWYLVQADIDIYNGMGWREIDPTFDTGFWTFELISPFANGSALDAWVPADTLDATQSAQRIDTGVGHLELASRTVDLGDGLRRYEYALMNFDFDRRVHSLSIPIGAGVRVRESAFSDATDTQEDDWVETLEEGAVTFAAPGGQALDWGRMVRVSITAAGASGVGTVVLEPESGPPARIEVGAPAPVPEPGVGLQLVCGGIALFLARRKGHRAAR